MTRKYTINALTGEGIDEMIAGVEAYQKWIDEKTKELARRLAEHGATYASLGFSRAIYTGIPANADVTVNGDGTRYIVRADGEAVLFLEFGAGVTYGYGHPEAEKNGMGPGTYPGQTHAMDPKGWWIPKSAGGGHTYGNPPNAPMYNAVRNIETELARIVREVFAG